MPTPPRSLSSSSSGSFQVAGPHLALAGGPRVRVSGLTLGGAVVLAEAPLAPGTTLPVEVRHPRLQAPVQGHARVRAARPGAGGVEAQLEFVGTWDDLLALRRALVPALGHRVLDGARPVGHVVVDSAAAWTVYDLATAKVAVVARVEADLLVRRKDDPPLGPFPAARSLEVALALAFGLRTPARCEPPLAGPALPPPAPRKAPPAGPSEEEILASKTITVAPARRDAPQRRPAAPSEEEILAAKTITVAPRAADAPAPRPVDRGGGTVVVAPPGIQPGPGVAEDDILSARTVRIGGGIRAQDIVPPELLRRFEAELGEDDDD